MSSLNLQELVSRHPSDRAVLERLAEAFGKGDVYDINRLLDVVDPPSEQNLMLILGEMVSRGLLHIFYRVESPAMGGIQDFDAPEKIPSTIHDWRTDREIPVTTDIVHIFYEVPSAANDHR